MNGLYSVVHTTMLEIYISAVGGAGWAVGFNGTFPSTNVKYHILYFLPHCILLSTVE